MLVFVGLINPQYDDLTMIYQKYRIGAWPAIPNVEPGASFLIPVPAPICGAILLGEEVQHPMHY
jgi:hypothetical protein